MAVASPTQPSQPTLPARALQVFEAEVVRLREQQDDLKQKIVQLEAQRSSPASSPWQKQSPHLSSPQQQGGGPSGAQARAGAGASRALGPSNDVRGSPSVSLSSPAEGPPDPAVNRLANELKKALAQADQKRQQAAERLQAFEEASRREEANLAGRLRSAQDTYRSLKAELRRLSARTKARRESRLELSYSQPSPEKRQSPGVMIPEGYNGVEDAELCRELLADLSKIREERDLALVEGRRLEAQLLHAREQLDLHAKRPPSPDREALAEVLRGTGIDPAAVDAVGVDAVEGMLRSEAAAMQTALQFYSREHDEARKTRAIDQENLALQLRQQCLKDESLALEEAEQRLAVGRACIADALKIQEKPSDALEEQCKASRALATECQTRVQHLQVASEPLELMVNRLTGLRRAADLKTAEFVELLGPLRKSAEAALHSIRQRDDLRGIERLVTVLAKICGSPRITFLALDGNHNGQISTCEFDSGLRNKLFLDYEAITGLKLRPIFRQLDRARQGFLIEEDLSFCCPHIWKEHGISGDIHGGLQHLDELIAAKKNNDKTPIMEESTKPLPSPGRPQQSSGRSPPSPGRSESSPSAGRSRTPTGTGPKASEPFSKQGRPNTTARSATPTRAVSPSPKASPASSPKALKSPREAQGALRDSSPSTKVSSTHRPQTNNTTSSSKNLRSSPKKATKVIEQTPQPKARSSPFGSTAKGASTGKSTKSTAYATDSGSDSEYEDVVG